jgi:hypothetical protein
MFQPGAESVLPDRGIITTNEYAITAKPSRLALPFPLLSTRPESSVTGILYDDMAYLRDRVPYQAHGGQ